MKRQRRNLKHKLLSSPKTLLTTILENDQIVTQDCSTVQCTLNRFNNVKYLFCREIHPCWNCLNWTVTTVAQTMSNDQYVLQYWGLTPPNIYPSNLYTYYLYTSNLLSVHLQYVQLQCVQDYVTRLMKWN